MNLFKWSIVFIVIQFLFNILTNINIVPEMFFFPWLVSKGQIPYIDFFDHHGFILYYILAPFSLDKSLALLNIFFLVLQMINLILFQLYLRRWVNSVGFIFGSGYFIFANFLVTENHLWFESFIVTFGLLILLILKSERSRIKNLLVGVIVVLVGLIKFPYVAVIVPLFLSIKKREVLFGFLLIVSLVLMVYANGSGLKQLYDGTIGFNRIVLNRYEKVTFTGIGDYQFRLLFFTLPLIIASIFITLRTCNFKKFKYLLILIGVSLTSLLTGLGALHILTFVNFGVILVAVVAYHIDFEHKFIYRRIFFVWIICLFILAIIHSRALNKGRPTYISNPSSRKIYDYLVSNDLTNNKFFVYGNQVELYYWADQLPPCYFNLKFPMAPKPRLEEYFTNFEQYTSDCVETKKVQLIVKQSVLPSEWTSLPILENYVSKNFHRVYVNGEFEILKKNV